MSELEKMREWLKSYEGMPQGNAFFIDYVRGDLLSAGLLSNGLVELNRKSDVLGNCTVTNQLNFALHVVMDAPPDHDEEATQNAEWLLNFQKWVQRQSVLRKAPTFGNVDRFDEVIRAQNGMPVDITDDGKIEYVVTISVQYNEEIINTMEDDY